MSHIPDIPELRIVRSADLRPHEAVDASRAHRLIHSLRNEGFLKNPPVVLPLSEDPEQYVVLDGANRTTAFQKMGFPHMLVQVARTGVEVRSWNHALMGEEIGPLIEAIADTQEVSLRETEPDRADHWLKDRTAVAYLATPNGKATVLASEDRTARGQVELLGRIVERYVSQYRVERTSAKYPNGLTNVYPDLAALVVHRQFSVQDVVEVVSHGALFPSGLTRFVISPRALRLNFPIAMLADRSSLNSKKQALEQWIRRRIEQQRVRYYAESTFLFDE